MLSRFSRGLRPRTDTLQRHGSSGQRDHQLVRPFFQSETAASKTRMAESSTSEVKSEGPKIPEEIFRVVVNAERQYSIWPDWKKNAPGWEDEGTKGTKQECLDHIEKVWTDMRPLSLQKFMAPFEKEPRKPIVLPPMPADGIDHFHKAQPPNELVKRLMVEQEVQIIRYLDEATKKPDLARLRRAIENGYVLVKFTKTQGGTELGANVKNDDPICSAEIDTVKNVINVKGRLKLDYCPVRLEATVDLTTFKGTGKLVPIDDFQSKKFS